MQPVTTTQIIEVWIAVGCTLLIYSFLYKDNPLFKLGEYIYVGITAGWGLCTAWFMVVWPDLLLPLSRVIKSYFASDVKLESNDTILLVIPLILGIFMLTRLSAKISWLSRYTFAFIIGSFSGMSIPLMISADLFKQIEPTLKSCWGADVTIVQAANTLIILVGVIAVLIYFFFSLEHKGVIKSIARTGIFYMMIAFGAAFGYTVMARESLAIGRITKLVKWASADYYYASIILFFIVAIIIILWELLRKRTPASPDNQGS